MQGDNRYEPVNQLWASVHPLPPCSREEAAKAVAIICRKFGKRDGGQWQKRDYVVRHIRRCWIDLQGLAATRGDALKCGWARIAHDLSHSIYDERVGPSLRRAHSGPHSRMELEIAQFVVASGWLGGTLKPKPKDKPTKEDKRALALERAEAAISRWQTKAKRAANALKKLAARKRRLLKAMATEV
jgi:hypothetical protein